jgi:transcriptional regulator with XRE-family HTH domain
MDFEVDWTARAIIALREALRLSRLEFARKLGVTPRTLALWETGRTTTPHAASRRLLYKVLLNADEDAVTRFQQNLNSGDAVAEDGSIEAAAGQEYTQSQGSVDPVNGVEGLPYDIQGSMEELLTILGRIHKLSRLVNPEIISQLQYSTLLSIAQYETVDPSALVSPLRKQRAWLDALLGECSHPGQRRQLFEIASETSGLLGYIAVGSGNFSLARAYCLESFQLGDHAQDGNLMAWARGMQSFCEYYAGQYDKALNYAQDGLTHAQSGPQSVRLAINGVARAMGKLGDIEGVHRAVDHTYELMSRNDASEGVPSSISLESYSPAQVAGNAATSYLSLAMPERVEQYVGLALPEMSDINSPWGRSLVMIDLARSRVLAEDADLDSAAGIMLDALDVSPGKPMMQVRRRGEEFVQDAVSRWGNTSQLRTVQEALASMKSLDEHHG